MNARGLVSPTSTTASRKRRAAAAEPPAEMPSGRESGGPSSSAAGLATVPPSFVPRRTDTSMSTSPSVPRDAPHQALPSPSKPVKVVPPPGLGEPAWIRCALRQQARRSITELEPGSANALGSPKIRRSIYARFTCRVDVPDRSEASPTAMVIRSVNDHRIMTTIRGSATLTRSVLPVFIARLTIRTLLTINTLFIFRTLPTFEALSVVKTVPTFRTTITRDIAKQQLLAVVPLVIGRNVRLGRASRAGEQLITRLFNDNSTVVSHVHGSTFFNPVAEAQTILGILVLAKELALVPHFRAPPVVSTVIAPAATPLADPSRRLVDTSRLVRDKPNVPRTRV